MMRKWLSAIVAIALLLVPASAWATDCSGTITTGGTAQTVFATPIRGLVIMNNSANLMCISFNGSAAALGGTNCATSSYVLQPGSATAAGGSFSKPEFMSIAFLSIISASTGDRFSCEFLR